MVYFRQLSMDQTEVLDMGIAANQLVSNMLGALMRGGTNDANRYIRSAKGQLDKIQDKLGVRNEPNGTELSAIRSAERLADISHAEWTNMTVADKASVIIEHFANGSVFDPVMCGFCADLPTVLSTLKLYGVPA